MGAVTRQELNAVIHAATLAARNRDSGSDQGSAIGSMGYYPQPTIPMVG